MPLYIDSLDCTAARQRCQQILWGCHLQGLCRSWELAASAPEASSVDPGDRLGALWLQVLSLCSHFLWLWLKHALQRGLLTTRLPLPNSLHEASWVLLLTQSSSPVLQVVFRTDTSANSEQTGHSRQTVPTESIFQIRKSCPLAQSRVSWSAHTHPTLTRSYKALPWPLKA